jgi:hypothetical protein
MKSETPITKLLAEGRQTKQGVGPVYMIKIEKSYDHGNGFARCTVAAQNDVEMTIPLRGNTRGALLLPL